MFLEHHLLVSDCLRVALLSVSKTSPDYLVSSSGLHSEVTVCYITAQDNKEHQTAKEKVVG